MEKMRSPQTRVILRRRAAPEHAPGISPSKSKPEAVSQGEQSKPKSPKQKAPAQAKQAAQETESKPKSPKHRAPGQAKQTARVKKTRPKKHKRQPPQVVFWPQDRALWSLLAVPMPPQLLDLFRFIVEELRKRDHPTVTVTGFSPGAEEDRTDSQNTVPCMTLDFSVEGLEDTHAANFALKVNTRWIHGGPPRPSGRPLRVLRYSEEKEGKYFHLEVTDNTRMQPKV